MPTTRMVVRTVSTARYYEDHIIDVQAGADIDQINWSGWEDAISTGVAWELHTHPVDVDGVTLRTVENVETVRCVCARNTDGSVTTFICPMHADNDPCLSMSQVTGRRRTGTIRRGVCTSCGWREVR